MIPPINWGLSAPFLPVYPINGNLTSSLGHSPGFGSLGSLTGRAAGPGAHGAPDGSPGSWPRRALVDRPATWQSAGRLTTTMSCQPAGACPHWALVNRPRAWPRRRLVSRAFGSGRALCRNMRLASPGSAQAAFTMPDAPRHRFARYAGGRIQAQGPETTRRARSPTKASPGPRTSRQAKAT